MLTKKLRIILLFMLMLGMTHSLHAGDKIKLHLHQPPPNKLGAADLWKLDITNTTNANIVVYLTGTVTEEKEGLIVDGKSKVFTVKPGKSTYGYNDFKDGEISWMNRTYEEAILRTGNVGGGNFNICVTAYFENGSVADNESCITQVIENVSIGMIIPISPGDGEEIDPDTLPGITFVWTGTGLKGPYDLRIVELKGSQSPDEAMKEDRDFFKLEDISTTTFQYPVNAPKLEKGKSYAWMVKSGNVESEVRVLRISIAGRTIVLSFSPTPNQPCCFDMNVTGDSTIPFNAFKLSASNILSVIPATPNTVVISPGYITLKSNSGPFLPNRVLGTICFTQVSGPFPVVTNWSIDGGSTFISPGDAGSLECIPCNTQNMCEVKMCVSPTNGIGSTTLDFGPVQPGLLAVDAPTLPLTITNCGTSNLYIAPNPNSIPALYGSPFSFKPDAGPVQAQYTILPGGSKIFNVKFRPTVANMTYNGTLWNIYSNASPISQPNPYVVTLKGSSSDCNASSIPTIAAYLNPPISGSVPATIVCPFGNVCVGIPTTQTIRIKNTAPCGILQFTPDLLPGSSPFTTNSSGSYQVTPGDWIDFTVTFNPVLGSSTQNWVIPNNSSNLPGLTIAITGTGVPANEIDMVVTPPAIVNFGDVSLTSSPLTKTKIIRVTNTSSLCSPFLQLTGSWPHTVGPFTISSPTYVSGSNILNGSYMEFSVTFDPSTLGFGTLDAAGSNWKTWTFNHNATNQLPGQTLIYHMQLKGRGTP